MSIVKFLTETYDYNQTSRVSNLIVYSFSVNDDVTYNVYFQQKRWGDKLIYIISFGSEDDLSVPNIYNPIKVIRTVFDIIENFYNEYEPDGLAYQTDNETLSRIYLQKIESLDEDYQLYDAGDFKVLLK